MEKSIQKAMDSVNQGKKIAEKSRFRPKFHFIAWEMKPINKGQ